MIGSISLGILGIGAVALGAKGFSTEGIPWSKKTNITGDKAKVIGGACILFGVLALFCAAFLILFQRQ